MPYLHLLGTLQSVQLAGLVAPGPNVLIVTQAALSDGRRTGMWVALGLAVCAIIWSSAAMLGIDTVASRHPEAYDAVRLIGCGYLIYIGLRMVRSAGTSDQTETIAPAAGWPAFRLGLLTSLSNPKAMLFFVGLFATILPPSLPLWVRLTAVGIIFLNSLTWHCALAWFFSTSRARQTYHRAGPWLDRCSGALFIILGVLIASSLLPDVTPTDSRAN